MWPFIKPKSDPRSGRLVFLIECLLNQNARDQGAAEHPALTRAVIDLLVDADVGMAQIPCPEIACLGFERRRIAGQSIRQALQTSACMACCNHLAENVAERIQIYTQQGFEVVAVLGGNTQSPACAVHGSDDSNRQLDEQSGVFMLALAEELKRRDLLIRFRGMRDADTDLLGEDLSWLKERLF